MGVGSTKFMRKLFTVFLVCITAANIGVSNMPEWKTLAPGLEITTFKAAHAAPHGDSKITILRIDPAAWSLEFATSGAKNEALTAKEWCAHKNFTAAINAGMFRQEGGSHAGYLLNGDYVYSKKITSYQSLAAFDPREGGH